MQEFMRLAMYDSDFDVRYLSILFVISCPGLFLLTNLFIIYFSSLGVHGLMELSTG